MAINFYDVKYLLFFISLSICVVQYLIFHEKFMAICALRRSSLYVFIKKKGTSIDIKLKKCELEYLSKLKC